MVSGLNPKLYLSDFLSYATLLQQQQMNLAQMDPHKFLSQGLPEARLKMDSPDKTTSDSNSSNNNSNHRPNHHNHPSKVKRRKSSVEETSSPPPASLSTSSSPAGSSHSHSPSDDLPDQEEPIDLTVKINSDDEIDEDKDDEEEDDEEREIENRKYRLTRADPRISWNKKKREK